MFRPIKYLILAACLAFLFIACSNDDEGSSIAVGAFGYQYIPLKINQEHVYQIDSIKYDDFTNTVDTLSFQRREVVADTLSVANDRISYRVDVYERANDSANWRLVKNISKTRTTIRYEHFEDNVNIIALVFPISLNTNWDGNLLNTHLEESFRYAAVHEPYVMNSQAYDSTITVDQRDEENRIQRIFSEERYAANVGLIYRKDINLETDLNGTIESGYDATIQLIDFTP